MVPKFVFELQILHLGSSLDANLDLEALDLFSPCISRRYFLELTLITAYFRRQDYSSLALITACAHGGNTEEALDM